MKDRLNIRNIVLLFFVALPLQTHVVFNAPVWQNSVFQFGIERLALMQIPLFLLVVYFISQGAIQKLKKQTG